MRQRLPSALAADGVCRASAGFLVLSLVLLAFGLAALAAAAPSVAQGSAEDAVGQVSRQQGRVTALREATARSLHLGAAVFQGDRIITAAAAKVEIAFADGSTLSLGADTQVDLESYSPAARKQGTLRLLIGIIRTSLSNLWNGGFDVRTQAAVASVRSTDWITEADEDHSAVFVVSGEVEVAGTAAGRTVRLTAGDGTDVDLGEAPSPPAQWGDARVEDVLARTRLP